MWGKIKYAYKNIKLFLDFIINLGSITPDAIDCSPFVVIEPSSSAGVVPHEYIIRKGSLEIALMLRRKIRY